MTDRIIDNPIINSPYKAPEKHIDPVARETLYQTKSRPFPRPEKGKIAVKVISRCDGEVLQVHDV